MALLLAIEPDPRQAETLRRLIREFVSAELILVDSKDAALAALARRVPDLLLLTTLLSPSDEAELAEHLHTLEGADHLQTLLLPILEEQPDSRGGRLAGPLTGSWRARTANAPRGCDPQQFADQILNYLERSRESREVAALRQAIAEPAADVPVTERTDRTGPAVAPFLAEAAAPSPPLVPESECGAAPMAIEATAATHLRVPEPAAVEPAATPPIAAEAVTAGHSAASGPDLHARLERPAGVVLVRRAPLIIAPAPAPEPAAPSQVRSAAEPPADTVRFSPPERARRAPVPGFVNSAGGRPTVRRMGSWIAGRRVAARQMLQRIQFRHAIGPAAARAAQTCALIRNIAARVPPRQVAIAGLLFLMLVQSAGTSPTVAPPRTWAPGVQLPRIALPEAVEKWWGEIAGAVRSRLGSAAAVDPQSDSAAEAGPPTTGRLEVITDPPGARVRIGSRAYGESPVTIDELPPGRHTLIFESGAGLVRETVRVEAGKTSRVAARILPGWVAIFAPVQLRIHLAGRLLGTTEDGRIGVPPGRHSFELVNERLGYRGTHEIEVAPGRVSSLSIELPDGSLSVDAAPGAEVWIDGRLAGRTPVTDLAVPIGSHDIFVRHPEFGGRRQVATVTLHAPTRVRIDLTR